VAHGLVDQLTSELGSSRITDRPGESVILHHVIDTEILDDQRLVITHDRGGECVQERITNVADAPMQPGHALTGLLAPVAPGLAP
jgi:hypothetical protein